MSDQQQQPIETLNVSAKVTAILINPSGVWEDEVILPVPAQLADNPRFREATTRQVLQAVIQAGALVRKISDDEAEAIPMVRVQNINVVLSRVATPGLIRL